MRYLVPIVFLFVSACAVVPSERAHQIQPAYPDMVVDCLFLGGVTGTSNLVFLDSGKHQSRFKAMEEAAKLGATHIVWHEVEGGHKPFATGHAYQCDR